MSLPPLSDDPAPLKWYMPDIHPEGRKYILIVAVAAFLSWLFVDWLTWPLLLLAGAVALFFRDPVRVTPQGEGEVVSPVDGMVVMVERVPLPGELAGPFALGDGPLVRVSIVTGLLDVHVSRTPISGSVLHVIYVTGRFLMGDSPRAAMENERQHILLQGRDGMRVGMTQIAGILARNITSFAKQSDLVVRGQRIGFTGCRLDLYLPDGCVCQVAPGQRAVAGETVLGKVGGKLVTGVAQ